MRMTSRMRARCRSSVIPSTSSGQALSGGAKGRSRSDLGFTSRSRRGLRRARVLGSQLVAPATFARQMPRDLHPARTPGMAREAAGPPCGRDSAARRQECMWCGPCRFLAKNTSRAVTLKLPRDRHELVRLRSAFHDAMDPDDLRPQPRHCLPCASQHAQAGQRLDHPGMAIRAARPSAPGGCPGPLGELEARQRALRDSLNQPDPPRATWISCVPAIACVRCAMLYVNKLRW